MQSEDGRPITNVEIGIHPFEFREFALGLFEAFEIRHLQPAVLHFPIVVGGVADPMLPTEVFDLDTRIGLSQDGDNLRFAKSSPFHKNLLGHSARKLYILPVQVLGKLTDQQDHVSPNQFYRRREK